MTLSSLHRPLSNMPFVPPLYVFVHPKQTSTGSTRPLIRLHQTSKVLHTKSVTRDTDVHTTESKHFK